MTQLCNLFLIHLKKRDTPRSFKNFALFRKDFTERYTDGSKAKGHVGIGIVTEKSAISFNLSLCISAFTANVYVLIEAVKKVISSQNKKSPTYTDSVSAQSSALKIGMRTLTLRHFKQSGYK